MAKKSDQRKTKAELLQEIKKLRKELAQCTAPSKDSLSSKGFLELCKIASWRLDYPSKKFHFSPELPDIMNFNSNNNHPTFENFLEAIHSDDRKAFSKNLEKVNNNHQSFNQFLHFKSSTEHLIPIFTRVDKVKNSDNGYSLVALVMDVSRLEKIIHSVEQERNRYRQLFELSPTGILIEDEQGIILDANPAFCKSLGYSRKELIGKKVELLAHPDAKDLVAKNIKMLLSGKTLKHNQKSIRKDGSAVYMELRETGIQLPSGRYGILCFAEDFTDLKKSQEEHLQKEKLQGVLEMAGAVCHELNQPLTTLFITTDLLLDFPEKDKFSEMIEVIKTEAIRISNITEKLMHITHYKTRKYINGMKIVDLDQSTSLTNK